MMGKVLTDTPMPPMGVAMDICGAFVNGPELFEFWLSTHGHGGEEFWRVAVLRECVPDEFEITDLTICGELLR